MVGDEQLPVIVPVIEAWRSLWPVWSLCSTTLEVDKRLVMRVRLTRMVGHLRERRLKKKAGKTWKIEVESYLEFMEFMHV